MFLLTKGPLSKIRSDAKGVKDLQDEGFTLVGECDADGNVTSTSVVIEASKRSRVAGPKNSDKPPQEGQEQPEGSQPNEESPSEETAAGPQDQAPQEGFDAAPTQVVTGAQAVPGAMVSQTSPTGPVPSTPGAGASDQGN